MSTVTPIRLRAALVTAAFALSALVPVLSVAPAHGTVTYKILITGDSITQGSAGDYTWRYRLWRKLTATAPGAVSFVGTRSDLYDVVNSQQGSQAYAVPFNATAHSAVWGDSFRDELGNIAGQITSTGANVLVVMLGSNDLAYLTSPADTAANLRAYIQHARAARPGIDIVVGEVLDRYDPWSGQYQLTSQVNEYATRLQNVASTLNTTNERVLIAPTRTGWDAATQTWDGTHPNPTGEALIAERISQGLAQLGIGTTGPDVSGAKSWDVPGPAPALTAGSEQIDLSWNRTLSGSTGMFIEQRLTNTNEPWKRLPYAVAGNGWTADLLAAGGTYQYRVVPSKGSSVGIAGPASTATAGGPMPGAVGSIDVTAGGDSLYGGTQATARWPASPNATAYLLSYRMLHNGSMTWDDLPYPVTQRNWVFEPLQLGRRYQTRIRASRGYLLTAWSPSPAVRTHGLPGHRAYAVLGDSYSSGLGASGAEWGGSCHRNLAAWGYQMQSSYQFATGIPACAGSTISGVRDQIQLMDNFFTGRDTDPHLISVTVGGNDIGFSDVLASCILGDCSSDQSSLLDRITRLQPALRSLYDSVQAAEPYADVIVGGYPQLVEPTGQSLNPGCLGIGTSERAMITRLSNHLNMTIAAAADQAGVWSVGMMVSLAFRGHNACTSGTSWINGLGADIGGEHYVIDAKSFHPDDGGQYKYAEVFSNALIARAG